MSNGYAMVRHLAQKKGIPIEEAKEAYKERKRKFKVTYYVDNAIDPEKFEKILDSIGAKKIKKPVEGEVKNGSSKRYRKS